MLLLLRNMHRCTLLLLHEVGFFNLSGPTLYWHCGGIHCVPHHLMRTMHSSSAADVFNFYGDHMRIVQQLIVPRPALLLPLQLIRARLALRQERLAITQCSLR